MDFRDTLSNFYKLLHEKSNKIFFFFIGSYPHREQSNHELPKIYKELLKYKIPTYRLYIDQCYDDDKNIKQRLGNDFIVYKNNISDEDYNMIIEFCHIAGRISSSISIVMEFTGLERSQLYKKTNMTDYLYITPTSCLADTENILYNPIIEIKKSNNHGFFQPNKIKFISNEIIRIFKDNVRDSNLNRLDILRETLKNRLEDLSNIYRLLLNYIESTHIFEVDYKITFSKNEPYYYNSIDLLKSRMGYNSKKTIEFIKEFEKTDYKNFEDYIKEVIQNIFVDCLMLECNGDTILSNQKFETIIFENSKDVYKIYLRFKNIFHVQVI